MSPPKRDIIRRVRVFAQLGDAECDAVLRVLKAKKGAPGDVLFSEGDPGDCLMIVLEGELVARVRTDAGVDEEVARLGPGEVVGEMAFIDAEPRSATVSTPGGATVLEFTRGALAELGRDAPRAASGILRNVLFDVARRLREAGDKLTDGAAGPRSVRADTVRRPGRGLTAEQLRAMPALAGYTGEDLDLLAFIATLRTFETGALVMEEGSVGDACWLVVDGAVEVMRGGKPVAALGRGALVGQLALLDRAPRSATVRAARDTTTLEVKDSAFVNLLRAHSPIALRFQQQVALAGVRQLRDATRKVAQSAAASSAGRMSAAPGSLTMLEDWDEGESGASLELDLDPVARPR